MNPLNPIGRPARREAKAWAQIEFGQAALGNSLRTSRLVMMAETAAQRPAGKVTEVFESSAAREGAYRFLESPHVTTTPTCQ